METWVVSCIIHVFGVLAEYALILKIIQDLKRQESSGKRREREASMSVSARGDRKETLCFYQPVYKQMDGMVTTPLTSEEAEKTLAQLEENKQTRLNRMKRDLKVNILFQCFHTFFQAFSISYIKFFYFQAEKSKRLQERVDSIAMYLFPCIFLAFNLIYWPYYLFYNVVDEDRPNQMTRQFTL